MVRVRVRVAIRMAVAVNFCRKMRTVQQPQPDDANPNTAESMVKTTGTVPVLYSRLHCFLCIVPAAFGQN
jgi:hypothetical protein